VWQLLCLAAVIVSLVAAISANLNKSNDLSARMNAVEACNAELEGLHARVQFGESSVKDAVAAYRQIVVKIPFVPEELATGSRTALTGGDTAPRATGAPPRSPTFNLDRQWHNVAFLVIVAATLFLLTTMVALFIGLSRGAAASPQPQPSSSTTSNSVAATISVGTEPVWVAVTPDGRHAYVSNSGSDNVSVIDTIRNTEIGTISVGPVQWGWRWSRTVAMPMSPTRVLTMYP
jgi:YVTN family beta-propeller protein